MRSRNVFVLSDERIAHFAILDMNSAGQCYGVQIYDNRGALLRHDCLSVALEGLRQEVPNDWAAVWKDPMDRFYFLRDSQVPIIQVATLEFAERSGD